MSINCSRLSNHLTFTKRNFPSPRFSISLNPKLKNFKFFSSSSSSSPLRKQFEERSLKNPIWQFVVRRNERIRNKNLKEKKNPKVHRTRKLAISLSQFRSISFLRARRTHVRSEFTSNDNDNFRTQKKKERKNEKKKKKKRGRKRKSVDRFHRGWIVCPREDCGRVLVRVWVYCTRNRGECRGRAWWLNYPRQGRVCSGSQRLSASNDGTQASIQAASQHPHRVGLESFIDKPKFIFFRLWF